MGSFEYNDGSLEIDGDKFRISPSQIVYFFDSTYEWYRTQLLGEEGFTGSTATHLGNCVHKAAELFINKGSYDYELIDKYIQSIEDPEVDISEINSQWQIMADTLIDHLSNQRFIEPKTEWFIHTEVTKNVVIGGSIDLYSKNNGGLITDFKTMGSLDRARLPKKVPRNYWFQQMAYAWILRQLDVPIEYFQLIYVTRANVGRVNDKGKPLKDYPSQVHVLKEPVTDEGLEIIEGVIKLIAESVELWKEHPEYRHLLAQDYRLKTKPVRLFK